MARSAVVGREVLRDGTRELDQLAVEEPLEIRLAGDTLAITMRTPGDDASLAVGYLFAEGVVTSLADVGSVAHCGRPGDDGYGNVIEVTPGPGARIDPSRLDGTRRASVTSSACGICGRRSIDDLLERIPSAPRQAYLRRSIVAESPSILARSQEHFRTTGGLHASAALDHDGNVIAAAEDVGRHNALDKVVGMLLYASRLDDAALMVVSGRVGFEIVQKVAVARIPVLAAVGAPTSLAVELAERGGITLAAFVRDARFNVYAHPERVIG
ncbi:MAG: formate dehydrogenase accessory sulfurtransferase FdhD [Sandaracinaceae bacterium]|nr:formate dehydrogenase accessory sulfurtransferase FdhD [Sandaracinaceae bacterium]